MKKCAGAPTIRFLFIAAVVLVLFASAPAAHSSEPIRHPRVGALYQYNARLVGVNAAAGTFTIRGISDNRESLTLAVHPMTKLAHGDKLVRLSDATVGDVVSGTFTISANGTVVAVSTAFGSVIPPRAGMSTTYVEVNGLASGERSRDPIHGNTTTFRGTLAMPQGGH